MTDTNERKESEVYRGLARRAFAFTALAGGTTLVAMYAAIFKAPAGSEFAQAMAACGALMLANTALGAYVSDWRMGQMRDAQAREAEAESAEAATTKTATPATPSPSPTV